MFDKKRLLLTFSSGRSSAAMVDIVLGAYAHKFEEIVIAFANTGWEHEDSLRFANECAKRWAAKGHQVVWLEAVVNKGRVACTHKIVTYKTASRNQEPFKEVIKKYGIPNKGYPHCTRELKENAIESYLRSIGWEKQSYLTAIGIRGDEPKRIKRGLASNKQIRVYPLADWFFMDKQAVLDFWKDWAHDLRIPEHLGNCVGCYRKSAKKIEQAYIDEPNEFTFAISMEKEHGHIGKNKIRGEYSTEPRMFYRGERTAENMIASFNLEQAA